jgi:hypothetical protein
LWFCLQSENQENQGTGKFLPFYIIFRQIFMPNFEYLDNLIAIQHNSSDDN